MLSSHESCLADPFHRIPQVFDVADPSGKLRAKASTQFPGLGHWTLDIGSGGGGE